MSIHAMEMDRRAFLIRSAAIGGLLKAARAPAQAFSTTQARPSAGPASQIQPFQMNSSWNTRLASAQPMAVAPREPSRPAIAPSTANSARCAPSTCARLAPSARITAASWVRSSWVASRAAYRTSTPAASANRNTS